ncbi:MAG TPA: hypothetical protein VG650_15975 [Mycobacteriales bacterium]|nr:hypothetical protein [Mycobacteriales bacterium]
MGDSGSDARRAELVAAYDAAVAADDVDAMAAAALGLTELQEFGPIPGRLPAFLHQAYERSSGRRRVELAIAIARTWSYGADPARAEPFVAEALAAPETAGDPALLAAALDAQLLTRWDPDDFAERAAITQRLEDVVAHLTDPEVRMSAHLWRMTTALEALDLAAVRRQLRGLEALAAETGSERVRFFAASRRAMYALLVGDLDLAERALAETLAAGAAAGEPDTFALERAITAWIARQRGDTATAAAEAVLFEDYAEREGVAVVAAEGSLLWLLAGEPDRAARWLRELAGEGFGEIARGVDWMFTVVCLTEVAAALGDRAVCERAIAALTPYAGRGVVDAGAVKFAGVVDDYLALAAGVCGRSDEAAAWRASAAAAYRRIGASWWLRRCEAGGAAADAGSVAAMSAATSGAASGTAVLRPAGGGVWEVGRAGATAQVRELKGFHYLRLLLARPFLPLPARELSDAVAGHAGDSVAQPSVGPALDRTALAAYRTRLAEIDDDLDGAGVDGARVERLEAEREALLAELRAAAGLGGRARATGGSSDERARVAVRKAIAAAIDRVREVDASLGRTLEVTVSTGSVCCYEPDPDRELTWQL